MANVYSSNKNDDALTTIISEKPMNKKDDLQQDVGDELIIHLDKGISDLFAKDSKRKVVYQKESNPPISIPPLMSLKPPVSPASAAAPESSAPAVSPPDAPD